MPALDIYHQAVRNALIKDGWTITHDPLVLRWGARDVFIDLGAEQLLAAQKESRSIAVEIKSFLGPSAVEDLKNALGQFILYHDILSRTEPERVLYLAVRLTTYEELFTEPIGALLLENERVRLLVFDPKAEVIVQWTP